MAETRPSDKPTPASLPAAFFANAGAAPDRPFLWTRERGTWTPWSWREVDARVRALCQGLRAHGLVPGERVVIAAENRPEFLIADLAVMAAGGISVPAYTTNTQADHAHVLRDCGASALIVSTPGIAARALPAAAEVPGCRLAIAVEPPDDPPGDAPPLYTWAAVLAAGETVPGDAAAEAGHLTPEDTACLIYTSGTGGAPKGVMLTHGNILANCRMAADLLTPVMDADGGAGEVFLSFLPLSHSYEHTVGQMFPMWLGARICYSRGVEHLASEMTEVRPTMMTAVPRLYESLHARMQRQIHQAPRARRWLFERALALGTRRYRRGGLPWWQRPADALLDRLVRAKVRARFGGRLKGMVAGGAPLDADIGIFFTALGVRVLQGYGQTEAGPVVACNPPLRPKLHTVGPPLRDVDVRIAADGEVLVRGPNVMRGYWRLPGETARTVRDGWLYTGDLGHLDEDGYLVITDRKKDIVVLSGGDTLSPARVETALTRQPEIAQAMVDGDGRPHLVALLVPEEEFATRWAEQHGKTPDLAVLAADPDFRAAMDQAVQRVNTEVSVLEKVRRVAVLGEPFTIDNGLLTPTMKIRRHKIREHHGETLAALR